MDGDEYALKLELSLYGDPYEQFTTAAGVEGNILPAYHYYSSISANDKCFMEIAEYLCKPPNVCDHFLDQILHVIYHNKRAVTITIMEYVPIRRTLGEILKEEDIGSNAYFFVKMCEKIRSLHEQNVRHGDLKGENVVENDKGDCVLVDIGRLKKLNREATWGDEANGWPSWKEVHSVCMYVENLLNLPPHALKTYIHDPFYVAPIMRGIERRGDKTTSEKVAQIIPYETDGLDLWYLSQQSVRPSRRYKRKKKISKYRKRKDGASGNI